MIWFQIQINLILDLTRRKTTFTTILHQLCVRYTTASLSHCCSRSFSVTIPTFHFIILSLTIHTWWSSNSIIIHITGLFSLWVILTYLTECSCETIWAGASVRVTFVGSQETGSAILTGSALTCTCCCNGETISTIYNTSNDCLSEVEYKFVQREEFSKIIDLFPLFCMVFEMSKCYLFLLSFLNLILYGLLSVLYEIVH